MRLWILVSCGVLILGAAIWPLRSPKPPAMPPVAPAVAAQPQQVESPKPAPPKVIEVIDLARAYEPVREPEEPAGTVNPASLIQVPDGPRRIPAAIDVDGDVRIKIGESPTGAYLFGVFVPGPEQIDVLPREVADLPPPVEYLYQMPRELKERCTGVREDDFVGLIGP
jgi:hypothetical protein